jgi:hypothetical protein
VRLGVCNLEDIARVSLGFKSLQNQFFYVSGDVIEKFHIEDRYLKPIFQLGDLDSDRYRQTANPVQWVFYCKDKEQDLRNTGALRYIRAMERHPAAEKKQTGKHQSIKQALQDQTSRGGTWYMPKAKLHRVNIWLRKAFNCIYSPFIFDPGAAVDQRCNYVVPIEGIDWKALAAVLTSTLFGLSAESFGAASMGAGALELATNQIQGLRIVDLRDLQDAASSTDLIAIAETVWTNSKPVDWSKTERPPQEIQDLDKWLLSRMETHVTLDRLYSDLVKTLNVRLAVAEDKDVQTKKGQQINIATVARSVAETVRPLLESRSFPDAFTEAGAVTQSLDFSRAGRLEVECHPMMGHAALVVRNGPDVLLDGQYARSVAQVIVKSLLLGRRNFSYPVEPSSAQAALKEFAKWFPRVLDKIATGCGMSAVGTSYEERVYDAVLEVLHLDRNIAEPEFFGHLRIHN